MLIDVWNQVPLVMGGWGRTLLEGLVAGRVGGPLQGGDRHVLRLPDVYTTDRSGSGRGSLHHLAQVHTVMIKTMSQITSQKIHICTNYHRNKAKKNTL